MMRVWTLAETMGLHVDDRDGLLKMKAAYEANPLMGDPHSLEGEMTENRQKLDKLKAELTRFQGFLESHDDDADFDDVHATAIHSNGDHAPEIQANGDKPPVIRPFEGESSRSRLLLLEV